MPSSPVENVYTKKIRLASGKNNNFFDLTMLSWFEQKSRQKNERQKDGVWHHAREVDDDGMEQTVNIFLSSIFLSVECFWG